MPRIAVTATLLAAITAAAGLPAAAQDLRATLRSACKTDYDQRCTGVRPGGGRIIQCLRDNADKLSPACKAALEQRRSRKPD